ncbi:probable phosphoglycerate mutase [Nocardia farcinica]|uniref:Bifunctional RNase H/acid phosphatase n=1 Tax=Nocardia farcinica TaxID=37329 RepID=A0A0H5P0X4_NOCFR|nr:phosphoglycerate mutase GpmB [Nocardia farcinica]PFX08834.1 phosphoglycerate mutase GpmB [Nocardia farcinica]CRY80979.1 bifunctional RNase H/acid phosphatase [Nocardia farcinica]SIT09876.1 probable phosphoglycerate mutase [Nocardia farcinica]VFA93436.1 bifunctional RNase H/acid phosphatase [Nocardia farcinica]
MPGGVSAAPPEPDAHARFPVRHSERVQLILVRHAQPLRVVDAAGPADPDLSEIGREQAERVPAALSHHHRITRVLSSPQARARQTAAPTAAKLGLPVEIVDDLAEYDRDLPAYIPIEDAKLEFRDAYERIKAGHLPEQIDGPAFVRRVLAAVDTVVAGTEPEDTVVAFAHGGVVNVLLQDVLGLARPLTFPIDYCSITRVLFSRTGRRSAATVNENGHVWDLLPRNRDR